MRKSSNIVLGIFLMIFNIPGSVFGRDYPLQHFTTENGLPSNNIYGLYRDSHGFIWMGSDKGIARFNGIEFEKFTTDDGLPDNDVFFFVEDYQGRVWMSTYNGELCFYKDGVIHTRVNTPFLRKYIKYSLIYTISLEKDSSITILFSNCLSIVNIKNDVCHSYEVKHKSFPTNQNVLTFHKLSEDKYLAICKDISFIIDTNSNVLPNSVIRNRDFFNWRGGQQGLDYVYSNKGIYTTSQKMILKFGDTLSSLFIYAILNCNKNLLIGTSNGLYVNNEYLTLKGNKINTITQDIEGNFWISTLGNGIYCLGKDYANIEEYNNVYNGTIIFACSLGNSLYYTLSNSNVYRFAHNKTLLIFDYYKYFGKYFRQENDWERHVNTVSYGHGLDDDYTYYNIEEKFSFIVRGVNTAKPEFILLKNLTPGCSVNIKEMHLTKDKIVTRNSDYITIDDKREIKNGNSFRLNAIGNITARRIFGLAIEGDSTAWFSGSADVNKVNGNKLVPQPQFRDITFKWMEIAGNFAIGITHKNQLLICKDFETNGITIETISGYNKDNATGQNFFWDKIYKLDDTTFLISTDNLYRLLIIHRNENPFYSINALENNMIPAQADYICHNDSFCYFFKKGDITRIPVDNLVEKHQPPVIYFKTLKTRKNAYPISAGMEISYNESKYVTISFSPFSFGSKYIICEYSISKDSSDYWRQVKNNEINLFDPSYGNYTVKVKARTLSGDFSAPFVFTFAISRPFWASAWFIVAMALLFIGSVTMTIRIIVTNNNRKKELQHQNEIKFLKSEYKALNALMNPHFIFNTLNNVQWLINNEDKLTANHYLRIFSDLVRQNMYNISRDLIPLANELELVNNYLKLEKLRFKDSFNYEINMDEPSSLSNFKIPPLLIQPLVENAIKHGLLPGTNQNNKLVIDISMNENQLQISVCDNGVGFTQSQKKINLHKSTGIENIRKRIEKLHLMHGIDISLTIIELQESGQPCGTLATICMDPNND